MNLVFLVTFLRYTCLLVIPLLFVRLVFLSFLVFFCFRAFLLFLFCVFSVFLPFPRSLLIPYFYHSHISLPIPRFTSFQLIFVIPSHIFRIPANSLFESLIPYSTPPITSHFVTAYYCCFCILLLFLRIIVIPATHHIPATLHVIPATLHVSREGGNPGNKIVVKKHKIFPSTYLYEKNNNKL